MFATSRLRGFARLSPAERRWLARALVLVPVAAASLRTLGLRRTQSLLVRAPRERLASAATSPQHLAHLVDLAARHGVVRAKCLATSIALQSLLASAGFPADLRIGVRKHGLRLEAHAWVEHEGMPLLGGPNVNARYRPFERSVGAIAR